jgi:hypothetical protein
MKEREKERERGRDRKAAKFPQLTWWGVDKY